MSAPVAVLGAGNWGTGVAQLAALAGNDVRLWSRSAAQCEELNTAHTNKKYTGDAALSDRIVATTDLRAAVLGASPILMIVPSKAFREVARALGDFATPDLVLLHGTKGLERETHKRMSELLAEETCIRQLGVVSGPNIATEILAGKPAGTVVASHFPRVVEEGRRALAGPGLRLFTSDDVRGVEYAGAFKNVVAIAAGMADALAVGENAKAMLVTRGIAEMARLAAFLGASPHVFFGMAGLGDLITTCASPFSRNHRLGAALVKGLSLDEAVKSLGMVAEGVNTARAAHELVHGHHVDLPLFERVYRVVHHGLAPDAALRELMRLPVGIDIDRALFRPGAP